MNKCEICRCNKICDHNHFGFENCNNFIPISKWKESRLRTESFGIVTIVDVPLSQANGNTVPIAERK